jgi:alkylation response protein AidB-like acyl-CoA dehydrogenase
VNAAPIETDMDAFIEQARTWLSHNASLRDGHAGEQRRVRGGDDSGDDFSVAVFHNLSVDEEQQVLDDLVAWNARKQEFGYHAVDWPVEFGGLGLTKAHAAAFGRLERDYELPASHELFAVTKQLIAPTVAHYGTAEQKARFIKPLLAAEILCCQLFSEPGAGSDLAGLSCRAVRDGAGWIVNGQKVWSSGAQFADWGLLLARSDPDVVKHSGMTAFMLSLDHPGVEVRPIKQMSGGSSFNEVFISEAEIPDDLRLGREGDGWKVALTTLDYERDHAANESTTVLGGTWEHLLDTARMVGVTGDPPIREAMMRMYVHRRVEHLLNRRAADLARSGQPTPAGSLGRIFWTQGMTMMSDVISRVLGPRLVADTGERGTYEWGEHVLGAPGYRIAGGSDEIQRNVIGERVLGLPREPRVDRDKPWRDVPR